jgi:monoamine oxidase
MSETENKAVSRRSLLKMIGTVAGSTAMYNAMTDLGFAQESGYSGPPKLGNPRPGASVLVLGAGIAGMVAALELRDAGYKVQVLEYNNRPGGRNWTLRGGDTYTELGGATQQVQFAPGQYFNPGPWRLPYHHQGILHYCSRLNVALEPFTQVNYNAWVHSTEAYGGKPRRYREVMGDFQGHVAELLAKCTQQSALDQAVGKEDKEMLLEALRRWGALDANLQYGKGAASSRLRGPQVAEGGGLNSLPVYSDPDPLSIILSSQMWQSVGRGQSFESQTPIFQPKGGMGQIGMAFGRELGNLIQYNAKVTDIHQDDKGVTATYVDSQKGGAPRKTSADWCVCTIPASILGQIPMTVGAPMRNAINSLSYDAAFKVGLEFKRRFWEEDDDIYGGITYTDQPIANISYPSNDYHRQGGGVLLGGYIFGDSPATFRFSALSAQDQIKAALEQGARIHPQYPKEFKSGVGVAWHRVPWTLGCSGSWSDENRAKNYGAICAIDNRIVLAGEHCSRLPAWQEGAVLSALDAVTRLHKRVLAA